MRLALFHAQPLAMHKSKPMACLAVVALATLCEQLEATLQVAVGIRQFAKLADFDAASIARLSAYEEALA